MSRRNQARRAKRRAAIMAQAVGGQSMRSRCEALSSWVGLAIILAGVGLLCSGLGF